VTDGRAAPTRGGSVSDGAEWRAAQCGSECGTASAIVLRPMIRLARARGVDVDAVLAQVGVRTSGFDDDDHRFPSLVAEGRMSVT
jgi:hypothetical protein